MRYIGGVLTNYSFLLPSTLAVAIGSSLLSPGAAIAVDALPQPTLSQSARTVLATPGIHDMGEARALDRIPFSVVLRFRNRQLLDQTVDAITDRHSPLYAHWLSKAQFDQAFAPTRSMEAKVMHTLVSNGFTLGPEDPTHRTVKAVGSVGALERYFKFRIHNVFKEGVGIRHLNLTDATFTPEMSIDSLGLLGIDQTDLSQVDSAPVTGPMGGLGPLPIEQAFDYPALSGFTGAGERIGIIVAGNYNPSDLALYQQYFQVFPAPNLTVVPIDGGGSFHNDSNGAEADLDTQQVYGLAPSVAIRVYNSAESGSSSITYSGEYDSINAAVNRGVNVISDSFSECELDNQSFDNEVDQVADEGASKGITLVDSSGDYGYGGCDDKFSQSQASFPASDTFVTAVGGLQSSSSNSFTSPSGWSGSGGYGSRYYPKPQYQVAKTPGSARVVPDVALIAGPPFVAEYFNGSATVGNGTSAAAPEFAAGLAEVDQMRNTSYGFANKSLLYYAFNTYGYSGARTYFTDITTGNNGQPAQAGWDFVTGIGAPDFQGLASL